ncbi:SCO family protein [Ramlibacter sp. AN1133]|uniref:SCO family protein n=1 Tax=Ramlibacter sp. AN1133 TaxID=3133429 RepID=UPI0030BA3050
MLPVTLRDLLRTLAFLVVLTGIWWNGPARAANSAPASPWGASYFSNVPLVTHDNKPVRFFDDLIKGKVVVINFIFTGCSAACGMETARLRQVQDLLGDRVGKDVFFYSISIDPENDTPEALRAYMSKFNVAPGWTFLTGKQKDIDLLRARLGLYMPPVDKATGQIDHDLAVIIGNQTTGRWQKASPMENPEVLATQVGSWLSNWKAKPSVANPKYENAPVRLPTLSKGEELFRTRCVTCHTVGQPGTETAKSIGPDLTHVTRVRPRGWLVRWMKEPDAVLAAKDPIAIGLYEKYNKLAMPNLKLSEADIEAVLSFLEQGSAAFQANQAKK